MSRRGSASDPQWYKDAVIYQLHVRSFFDQNNDGIGDFPGLIEKLDYLQGLGVSCLWLLPFYRSPLRDDGYDIAHYEDIHPSYGTMKDFRAFLRAAHDRGLQVITELVINHTSDQHPWFQAARRAPAGSHKRNYYVWSDTKQRYEGARIIFSDSETSNWQWDTVANAYYWHRFFFHQPDLNFDNPHVRKAVFKVMRFWFDQGVDGMRLDAVPYLIEREGTTCENLPETHQFLRDLRRDLDARYEGRMLLAEANQWPADVCSFYGEGDECHMAFNFPLMPRMYMALRQEDSHPIADILRQTPEIPSTCQWALFLRNHDELTLEMVTDEERDYLYQAYASDPQMRVNGGIRRRLAPLMENDRQRIELLTGLLFSLPGTPVVYYGDEIGMGDNIYLGDRNSVRTPMQWTSDRNGGFSRADPARLFFPVVMDPVYGYQGRNVESQERSPASLLNWMKRAIALRRRHRAFGRGTLTLLSPSNRKILAFVRQFEDETILCVANLSRTPQPAELDLSAFKGRIPLELTGDTEFPRIGEMPYFITLGRYAAYWFLLRDAPEPPVVVRPAPRSAPKPPDGTDMDPLLLGPAWDKAFDSATRSILERLYLPHHLATRRWFAARSRTLHAVRIRDYALVSASPSPGFLTLLDVTYADGGTDTYCVPMAFLAGVPADEVLRDSPDLVVARISGARRGVLHERLDLGVAGQLVRAIVDDQVIASRGGSIVTTRFPVLSERLAATSLEALPIVRFRGDQNNTSFLIGNRLVLKVIRRIEPGTNPEFEVGFHLSERARFSRAPRLAGVVEHDRHGERSTLAVLHEQVPHQTTGWNQALGEAARFYERAAAVTTAPPGEELRVAPGGSHPTGLTVPEPIREHFEWYIEALARLGRRTADLHAALSTPHGDAAFEPEPITASEFEAETAAIGQRAAQAFELLRSRVTSLSERTAQLAEQVLATESNVHRLLAHAVTALPAGIMRTRIHGDYQLGQVLWNEGDFFVIDFEGDPAKSIAERRAKQSPIRDIATLARSLSYAAYVQLSTLREHEPDKLRRLAPWAAFWDRSATELFVQSYRAQAGTAAYVPHTREAFDAILRAYLLDESLTELIFELDHRPNLTFVPLVALRSLLTT
jgi:maltose alpha-D-glucosyltransferase/alpha-amylase